MISYHAKKATQERGGLKNSMDKNETAKSTKSTNNNLPTNAGAHTKINAARRNRAVGGVIPGNFGFGTFPS